jgi:hypothetical protein
MIQWLQRIFLGHAHKWKIINKEQVSCRRIGDTEWQSIGVCYTQQCEECGKVTHYNAF